MFPAGSGEGVGSGGEGVGELCYLYSTLQQYFTTYTYSLV